MTTKTARYKALNAGFSKGMMSLLSEREIELMHSGKIAKGLVKKYEQFIFRLLPTGKDEKETKAAQGRRNLVSNCRIEAIFKGRTDADLKRVFHAMQNSR